MGNPVSRREGRFGARADECFQNDCTGGEFPDRVRPGRQQMYAAHGVGKHPRQRRDYKVRSWCLSVETGLAPSLREIFFRSLRRYVPALYWNPMRPMLRFLWNSSRGHRIAPWRSPYLLWRIETYTGVKMTQI